MNCDIKQIITRIQPVGYADMILVITFLEIYGMRNDVVTCDANEYKTVILFIILIRTISFNGLKLNTIGKMAAKIQCRW